jgi:uncharacterized protein YndB with AHSA1/START domain
VAESLERVLRVHCSLEHAFAVFTQGVDLWWPRGHRRDEDSRLVLEPEVGGRFLERAASGEERELGRVLLCDPPHRISYTWHPGAVTGPTRVDVSFAEDGADTVVRVVHSEGDAAVGDAWPERAALFARGWDLVLPSYAARATRGRDGAGRGI